MEISGSGHKTSRVSLTLRYPNPLKSQPMRSLYHWPLDPASRQARIALGEVKLKFKLEPVNPWQPDEVFQAKCPEALPPCLMDTSDQGEIVIAGARAICEYLHESTPRHPLLSNAILERAEARRLCTWFEGKFANEVNAYILYERVEKGLSSRQPPDPSTLRMGRDHLAFHLDYISWLLGTRDWLAGPQFSLADIAAGASLSCLDFIDEVNWQSWPHVKTWYQKLKSRPSFQPLLTDRVPGLTPPPHYSDLDF